MVWVLFIVAMTILSLTRMEEYVEKEDEVTGQPVGEEEQFRKIQVKLRTMKNNRKARRRRVGVWGCVCVWCLIWCVRLCVCLIWCACVCERTKRLDVSVWDVSMCLCANSRCLNVSLLLLVGKGWICWLPF